FIRVPVAGRIPQVVCDTSLSLEPAEKLFLADLGRQRVGCVDVCNLARLYGVYDQAGDLSVVRKESLVLFFPKVNRSPHTNLVMMLVFGDRIDRVGVVLLLNLRPVEFIRLRVLRNRTERAGRKSCE